MHEARGGVVAAFSVLSVHRCVRPTADVSAQNVDRTADRCGGPADGNPADRRHGPLRFQLGRLATRDAEQRRAEGVDPPRFRDAMRRRARIVASLALIAALGGVPRLHAETAEECRTQCSFDLEACKNGCLDSHFFDGCLDDYHSDEEDCLRGCR